MPILTVFTPTYNRAHTLPRTYESLCHQTCKDFEWLVIDDGSTDGTEALVTSWIAEQNAKENGLNVRYIYKENGGLYTGYNTAYANIDTELCVCIDSDDYMPDDAVEKILNGWQEKGSDKYCGIVGLDYNVIDKKPIGGKFPDNLTEVYQYDFHLKHLHRGDTKQVMRTDLMKAVAPMVGFPGEKNFNPIYLLLQVCDKKPLLVLNENLCWVEYQSGADSMSQAIYKQYMNSPRSFAKLRLLEMSLTRNNMKDRFRSAVHYVSSCIIAKDGGWLKNARRKVLVLLAAPLGLALSFYIRKKAK